MSLGVETLAPTAAAVKAARNWAANLRTMAAVQPRLIEALQPLAVAGEWVFARDGSLTLLDDAGRWLGDCSVPYLAAAAMIKSFEPRGTVAGFLAPTHAAEIRAALDRLTAQQSVLVLQPNLQTVRTILSCEDFSADFEAHRLHIATTREWAAELRTLFNEHPGLPTPQQFIKLPTALADIVDPIIAESQKIFGEVIHARAERIRSLRGVPREWNSNACRVGVIAGSKFALWDDAGAALAEALRPASSDARVRLAWLDPDIPIHAGPAGTAEFCRQCDAVVTADTARCDFTDVLPAAMPWVTWVTKGRIPSATSAGPRDALLVADAAWKKRAIEAGWPADRVGIATFPAIQRTEASPDTVFDGWTILTDTTPIQIPEKLEEFSSHRLLWEAITANLAADPFALGDDLIAYLRKRARAMSIDNATIDRLLFAESLLVPAYQQGIARAMMKERLPIRVFGRGWSEIDEFKPVSAGPIESRSHLARILADTRRVVHLWPWATVHPIDSTGLPTLRRTLGRLDSFLQQARQPAKTLALAGETRQAITIDAILAALTHNCRAASDGAAIY